MCASLIGCSNHSVVGNTVYKLSRSLMRTTLHGQSCANKHQISPPEDKMFTQRHAHLRNGFLSAVTVLLLLTTATQPAVLTNDLQTTVVTPQSNLTQSSQLNNSSMETPVVLPLHRSCGGEHENFCENGGVCMYPQDSDKPFCICTRLYSGPRCLFFSDETRSQPELEKVIGITFGVLMLLVALAIMIYCFAFKRCVKSAPLIKSAPSETSV